MNTLILEQEELQGKTNRSNTIDIYSYGPFSKLKSRDLQKGGIRRLIEQIIEQKGNAVWIDLACGNGIALRQGKAHLEDKEIDVNLLRAYGYDALPVNPEKIKFYIDHWPDEYDQRLLDPKYAHIHVEADIETAVFPEKPDLVTIHDAFLWTHDPLKIFANAARQMKPGAIICMNRLATIFYSREEDTISSTLFEHINENGFPGFYVLYCGNSSAVLQKKRKNLDFAYGYRLVCRHEMKYDGEPNGFSHVYRQL